jgi:cbb3-type cytochrome oxidase maturation protein
MYLLVPISVLLVFIIAAVFWWSLRHGQFEDLEGPAYRMLMDDDTPEASKDEADAAAESGVADRRKS